MVNRKPLEAMQKYHENITYFWGPSPSLYPIVVGLSHPTQSFMKSIIITPGIITDGISLNSYFNYFIALIFINIDF